MMPRRSLLICAGLALGLMACGRPAPPMQVADDPEVLGAAALDRGDYAGAAALYRRALERRPGSIPAHYGLGVASSNLNQRPETIVEFQWVITNGKPGSFEVDAAQTWLITAGVLRRPAAATAHVEPDRNWKGSLDGQAYLGSVDQRQSMKRLQLHLVGQPDGATKEERRVTRTDNEGRFRFSNLVPGTYMLTDRVAGKPQWRVKVEVSPGSTLRLDLSSSNGIDARDDFPGRG